MNQPDAIAIPSSLRPSDGRFGSGPSRVSVAAIEALASTGSTYLGTSHRRQTVRDVVTSVRSGLSDLYDLPQGYEVVLGIGGATAFWDCAVFGLVEKRSAHFTCGEFSAKFATAAAGAPHLEDPVIVEVEPGLAPEPRTVVDVDMVAYIHNETSTGVLAPFARLGDSLVVVDGTSAAGAIPIETTAVDAYYFSPQKALGSEGGLWLALMSPLAIERARSIAASGRAIPPFLSLTTAIENSRLNQTYNTPSLATLFFLNQQITHLLEQGGLEWAERVTAASSGHLYSWAEASPHAQPFVADPQLRSPTVATIDFTPPIDADAIASHLRHNGIVDTESYRKLGRNQLRIATFPTIPTSDVEALTGCVDYIIDRM
jgi:phosphoserine aminotransferase